jgi:hypothetical protein
MFDEFDKQVSILSESIVRSLSRRRMLGTAVKGTIVTLAGASLGIFTGLRNAFAAGCTCNWYGGGSNANCPSWPNACNIGGVVCPSGCSPCTSSDVCKESHSPFSYCNYPNASWTSCTGLGTCGNGYKICVDCKCPNCSYVCTCLSVCYCCNCCNPKDVEIEMRRLAQAVPIQA